MSERTSHRTLPPARQEPQDVGVRFMVGLFALIGTTALLLMGLAYWIFPKEVNDDRFAQPFPSYPAPQLQASPPADMRTFYAQEIQRLNSAGWLDRGAGAIHIPIDQAMRDVAREGIPGWPAGRADVSQGARR